MYSNFSNRVNDIIKISREEAIRLGHDFISVEHLMLAIIQKGDSMANKILNNLDVDSFQLKQQLENSMLAEGSNIAFGNIPLTKQTEKILRVSILEAKLYKAEVIGTEHLLLSIAREEVTVASQLLAEQGATYQAIHKELDDILSGKIPTQSTSNPIFEGQKQSDGKTKDGKTKPKDKPKTPVLDNFSRDLTKLAATGKLDPVIGREKEIERVSQILSRRKKNNPVLIGEPGVGKTAIVEGLALRIIEKKVSRSLFDKRVVS